MNIKLKLGILYSIISFIYIGTLIESKELKMDRIIPHPTIRFFEASSIAISALKYDLDGFQYFTLIRNNMKNMILVRDSDGKMDVENTEINLVNPELLNSSIRDNLSINNIRKKSTIYFIEKEDVGLASYYKYSFLIFGYDIASLNSLYFLIFGISLLIYLLTFKYRIPYLVLLIVFMCAHWAIVSSLPMIGMQLQTVSNSRFLPVLAILPSMHLAFLTYGTIRYNIVKCLGAVIQTFIIMFVIHSRSSAVYSLIFLSSVFVSGFIIRNILLRYSIAMNIFKSRVWPLFICIAGYIILNNFLLFSLSPIYGGSSGKHLFWDQLIKNLGVHPQGYSKYLVYTSDQMPFDLVERKLENDYNIKFEDWPSITSNYYGLHEQICKNEFIRILKKDPLFILEAVFIYKPIKFINTFKDSSNGILENMFRFQIIILLISSFLIGGKHFQSYLPKFIIIGCLGFFCSSIVFLLSLPVNFLIADSGLILVLLIFLFIMGIITIVLRIINLSLIRRY